MNYNERDDNNIKQAKAIIQEYFKEVDKRDYEKAVKEKEMKKRKSNIMIVTYLGVLIALYFMYRYIAEAFQF